MFPMSVLCYFLTILSFVTCQAVPMLVDAPGKTAIIPNWHIQSTSKAGNDASKLSQPGVDVSAWTLVGSRGTLMGGLVESKKYDETDLFYSNNLENFDSSQFNVPWFYRTEFSINRGTGSHYLLRTHGISSRADVYLNGALVADKNVQAGAYVGHTFDITNKVKNGTNVVLIRVYQTNYLRDFALGFVDWNPYPPDNGTGVWRNVEIKQTGPVSISSPRVVTASEPGGATITVKVDIQSHINGPSKSKVRCSILEPDGKVLGKPEQVIRLLAGERRTINLTVTAAKLVLWWPKQWGGQPLYKVQCFVDILDDSKSFISDLSEERHFGVRYVTSELNGNGDIIFTVNNKPFKVLGAGYTSDIFLRFDASRLRKQFQNVLNMGLNTVRLEGKQEHPELYDLADEMGLMILAGWECCDKWEGWTYNDEGSGEKWVDADYSIANLSMRHEAEMMQNHPSMLAFLVGSDFWPDDRATKIYVDALKSLDWNAPIVSSASKRGYPELLGPGGMKMEGPYDWVPPNYWYSDRLGAAFGFGSELGAGVGTPELGSLRKFLSPSDLEDLWKAPDKGLYHMSTKESSFYTRKIYNDALFARYGAPTSLEDYLWKAQLMDYEATRSQFEAYTARWNASRPATGMIYWMLNNAWPGLHWNLFDYYGGKAGSYYGAKVGARKESLVLDYASKALYVINRSLNQEGKRVMDFEIMGLDGKSLLKKVVDVETKPNWSMKIWDLAANLNGMKEVVLLRLTLRDPMVGGVANATVRSRNTYWIAPKPDVLDWDASTWYYTPVSQYANFTSLFSMKRVQLSVSANLSRNRTGEVILENKDTIPAVFVRLEVVEGMGEWEDNYVTVWPGERRVVGVVFEGKGRGLGVAVDGINLQRVKVDVKNG